MKNRMIPLGDDAQPITDPDRLEELGYSVERKRESFGFDETTKTSNTDNIIMNDDAISALSVDAIRQRNDDVDELIQEKNERIRELEKKVSRLQDKAFADNKDSSAEENLTEDGRFDLREQTDSIGE